MTGAFNFRVERCLPQTLLGLRMLHAHVAYGYLIYQRKFKAAGGDGFRMPHSRHGEPRQFTTTTLYLYLGRFLYLYPSSFQTL